MGQFLAIEGTFIGQLSASADRLAPATGD